MEVVTSPASSTHRAIDAVWRIEAPRLIAGLTRLVRDVGLAEDLAGDALVAALEQWPASGLPTNPGAWLMTVARRRGVDIVRRRALHARNEPMIAEETVHLLERASADPDAALDHDTDDDVLRLVFMTCHPVLSMEARVAMTLRLLGGLTTEEIARAFLAPVQTIAQRIVRAKRTLAEAKVPFEMPRGPSRDERLASVLEVVYLVFNEGYSATAGDDWMRPALCEDAMRLGRALAALSPNSAEVHGLVALMELQASRTHARTDSSGAPVLLLKQDRSRWDHLLIGRGLAALARAESLGPRGPYTLQAAIAACHARARRAENTEWARIAALYAELAAHVPSPVVELNRAVAVGMADGPAAGLALVDALRDGGTLADYHLLYATRADLLAKLDRIEEARAELEHAATLTRNEREREMLRERASAL